MPHPSPSIQPARRSGWLHRLGLDRPELRAWAMYDWANSAMVTTIMTAVFPVYFVSVAGAGMPGASAQQRWNLCNGLSTAIVAALSPMLGAIADYRASRIRMLVVAIILGVGTVAGMYFIGPGEMSLASTLFILSTIAVSLSFVFYESLLPHIASEHEIDRVSTAGYALGYVGGGILLALNLLWILRPQWFGLPSGSGLSDWQATLPTRLSFLSVAIWWLVFSIPMLLRVREPPRVLEPDERAGQNPVRIAVVRLGETFRELRRYKQAFLLLVAFLIYNDGITTIYKNAAVYGVEIGIGQTDLIAAILLVQFIGIPFSFLFGAMAARIGAKRSVLLGLGVYIVISIFGYFMKTARDFYILAILVAMVQGGTQALSRSLFATMVPRHKSGEFFGFYSVFSKFAGIFGPLLFAAVIQMSGSSRNAILSVILFFILGSVLLAFVNVKEGEEAARAAERSVHPAPTH